MPELTIDIPNELSAIAAAGSLEADAAALREVVVWNIEQRAHRMREWAEGNARNSEELRALVGELDRLAAAIERIEHPARYGGSGEEDR